MKRYFSFVAFVVFFVFCSCNNNKTLQSQAEAFAGQQVVFPDSTNVFNAQNKLIIWFDSTECVSCRMNQLYEWDYDPVVRYTQVLEGHFDMIVIFSPKKKDVQYFQFNIKRYIVSFPVIVDEGVFPKLNPHIPADKRLHAFLLDKNNKVVMVGNPLGNEKLWELYKDQIRTLVNER
jgi:hypothetical protein